MERQRWQRQSAWAGAVVLAACLAPGPVEAWSAAVGGSSSLLGNRIVSSAAAFEELLAVPFELRRPAHCAAFGSSRANLPGLGFENQVEFGLREPGFEIWIPHTLSFVDDPGTNDAFHRSVSAARVFDGLERGAHSIAWSAIKGSAQDEDVTVERSELSVVCAKREIPWRDRGRLPASAKLAVGGFTGAGAVVTEPDYDRIQSLHFELVRPSHCVALASGVARNPGGGSVDNLYEFVLARSNEGDHSRRQRFELDDNAGVWDPRVLPVSAVLFFPDIEPGQVELTWLGRKAREDVADLSFEDPTLAAICAKRRLGAGPVGGAAAGGAFEAGPIEIGGEAEQTLAALAFELRRPSRCAAFASASATNPGGGTLDNVYRFRLASGPGASSWDHILEFDDNAGVDDAGALPIALTHVFELEPGAREIRFVGLKEGADDADLSVAAASLGVVCTKVRLGP